MEYINGNYLKNLKINECGNLIFLLGAFFLPSTLLLSAFFLLPASIIGIYLKKENYFKDIYNQILFLFGLLICINALLQNFLYPNNYPDIWDPTLSLIGLGNWIPFIFLFWSYQPFLDSVEKRKNLSLVLISSSFPVIISGFGQYFFDWHGPLEILNGLIVWYQYPIKHSAGLSGLFNNQNYAGSWLNLVWPFCIAFFLKKSNIILNKFASIFFLISVSFASFLTQSRNAWAGLIFSTSIMIGRKKNIFFMPMVFILIAFLLIASSTFLRSNFQEIIRNIIPNSIWLNFSPEGYSELEPSRIDIYLSAFKLALIKPFTGIGAAAFTSIFQFETSFWKGHSHNILLELAISYGLPATILLLVSILSIIMISGFMIFKGGRKNTLNTIFDRAIWISLFFFAFSQLFDVQYFDGKISITFWILAAALRNIIREENYKLNK